MISEVSTIKLLIVLSNNIKINEYKKACRLIKDLIRFNHFFYLYDNTTKINELINICIKNNYHNYLISNESLTNFDSIIVIGLRKYDKTTKLLNSCIGTNTNLYIIACDYGFSSDGTSLVNDGALLITNIYDLDTIS